MANKTIKTFPLTVTEGWLDDIERCREKSETKHSFILTAVRNEILRRKDGINIIREDD